MLYTSLKILLIIVSLFSSLYGQDDNKVLAKIGSQEITVEEFRNRFEFMPHLNYSSHNPDTLRIEFLYSLVAEKLWSIEAAARGLDNIEEVKYSLETLKKLFIKDELYRQEVESKLILSNDELAKGLLRVARILYINIIISTDSAEIHSLYKLLSNGADFDSLLKTRNEYQVQQKPLEVKLGSLDDELVEDIVFNLKEGEISKPIKSKEQWLIIKVRYEEIDNTINPSTGQAGNKVITALKNRKQKNIAGSFIDNILGGKSIAADRKIFDKIYENLNKVIKERTDKSETDSIVDIQMIETDITETIKSLSQEDLNFPFIEFDDKPATLREFLYYMIYQKVNIQSLKPEYVKSILNASIKHFIEDEILFREGVKRGLDNFSSVKNDLKLWKEYYLSEVLMQSYADSISVTESDIQNHLMQINKSQDYIQQVDIIEILTDNLDEIELILAELNNGEDFEMLAKKYNKREFTKNTNGRWGYFPVNSGGEIGRIANQMEAGEIYGPLKVPEGYSIFKLIDKKTISHEINDTQQPDIQFIRMKIALAKMNNLINNKTVDLADKYGISVDEKLLKQIELSEVNTFTYRLIGFGGKIAAFPVTVPMFEWYQLFKERKELP